MKKAAIFSAFITILFCYLEWSGGNSAFVYEIEYLILFQKEENTDALTHPAVFVPLLGQLILLIALFQKNPDRRLVYAGITLLGVLSLLLFLVGVLAQNIKIVVSTLPFLASAIWCFRVFRRQPEAA